ncbi:helix-turn-helix domain-containing protein [Butyrivibrio sp. MC2013]|uniref:helix-turn-helix domain-containing protein n=1 Tax=Butyrivibrio sp. MC2013 TaxID=1280686 RepID=UPI0003F9ECFA|nr:AraC family transcriptional regulator [Butyrivibrio sp. MC2013]
MLFRVIASGYNFVHPKGWNIYRPQGIGSYIIVYIRNRFYYDDCSEGAESRYSPYPAYMFYKPGQAQHFYLDHEEYADDWMHFEIDEEHRQEAESFIDALSLPWGEPAVVGSNTEAGILFRLIGTELRKHGPSRDEILDCLLKSLLYKLSDICGSSGDAGCAYPSSTLESYRQSFDSLRNRLYQGGVAAGISSVDEIAGEMNLSTSYFQHIYKALYGIPVTRDLITARIEYAAYLLQNHAGSIGDIASSCGYESVEHFNRQFRKIKGCSPSRFISAGDYKME